VSCADADAFGWQQQYAVCDSKKSATLTNQLSKAGMASRGSVSFLVDLVYQLQFFISLPGLGFYRRKLLPNTQVFTDQGNSRLEDALQQARIEPRRFTGIFREHGDKHAKRLAVVTANGKYQQRSTGRQRPSQFAGLRIRACNNFKRKFAYERINFVVIDTVAAPDAAPGKIVKTEALSPGNQRLQEAFGRADIFSDTDIVQFRGHTIHFAPDSARA
jgi:hypothetical protein